MNSHDLPGVLYLRATGRPLHRKHFPPQGTPSYRTSSDVRHGVVEQAAAISDSPVAGAEGRGGVEHGHGNSQTGVEGCEGPDLHIAR